MKEGHLFIIFLWFEINICFNANSNNLVLYLIFILGMYL